MAKYVDYDGLDHFYDNIADRPVQAFDTVADMQAATYLETGMTCHTNGFHASGDGGAAYYMVSASGTADGATTIACANSLYAHAINVEKDRLNGDLSLSFLGRTIETGDYGSAQGMCAVTDDGTTYIYTVFSNYDTTNEQCIIKKMDTAGNVSQTSSPMSIGHGGTLVYHDESSSFITVNENVVIYISKTTLTISNTVQSSMSIDCLCYDYDNDLFYASDANGAVYTTSDFINYDKVFDLPVSLFTFVQSLTYYAGYIYCVSNQPNKVLVYDVSTYRLIDVAHIGDYLSDYYPIGEVQCIAFYSDGLFVVNGKPRLYDIYNNDASYGYGITAYGQGGVNSNGLLKRQYNQLSITEYLTQATVNSGTYVFTPTGRSTAPFYSLYDVALCLNGPQYMPDYVNLVGSFTGQSLILNHKSVRINGNNAVIDKGVIYHSDVNVANVTFSSLAIVNSQATLKHVDSIASATFIASCIIAYFPDCPFILSRSYSTGSNSIVLEAGTNLNSYVLLCDHTRSVGNQNTTETLTLNYPIANFKTLVFEMLSSNGRIAGAVSIPYAEFTAGVYLHAKATLDKATNFDTAVFVKSGTNVQLAGQDGHYRILGK